MRPDQEQFESADANTLLDFYQLKTLDPVDYLQSSARSNVYSFNDDDDTDEISKVIPRDQFSKLLPEKFDEKGEFKTRSSMNWQDPLGFHESVLDELIDKDVIDDSRDPKRLKYLIGSKTFNAKLFLTTIHKEKTYRDLERSVVFLERSLEAEKPKLQRLIGDNFQKVIDNKKLLDEIYSEYSSSSMSSNVTALSESIGRANTSSTLLLNPVLGGMARANEITAFLSLISENSVLLDLPKNLTELIQENDFDSILREYEAGRKVYESLLSSNARNKPILNKLWSHVEETMNEYKKELWEKLGHTHIENINPSFSAQLTDSSNNFLTIIKRLLELGVEKNPVTYFLDLEYKYLLENIDGRLTQVQLVRFLRSRESVVNVYGKRKNKEDELSNTALGQIFALLVDRSAQLLDEHDADLLDLPLVMDLWGFLTSYVNELTLEFMNKKLLKFASIIEFFVSGDLEKKLPLKNKNARRALRFEPTQLNQFEDYFRTLVGKLCKRLHFLFEASSEDLARAMKNSQKKMEPKLSDEAKDINLPESFGFIPPHSNVITTLNYSLALQHKIFENFETLEKSPMLRSGPIANAMKSTLARINSNFVNGVLCILVNDARKLNDVDNWSRSTQYEGCTKLPEFILSFYQIFIPKLKSLLLFQDQELYNNIQNQFLKMFHIMIENQLENVFVKSMENSALKDFYFTTTLSNLSCLKIKILPRVLKLFDSSFGTTLSTSSLDIYSNLEHFESKIYNEYLVVYKTQIGDIISSGVRSIDWFQFQLSSPHSDILVSSFTLRSINLINMIKSKLLSFNSNKTYIMKIELDLINYLVFKLIESLKEIQQFNSSGLLQITVDLKFLVDIFQHFNESGVKERINLDKLSNVAERFLKKNTTSADQIKEMVRKNLLANKAQMDCFYGL